MKSIAGLDMAEVRRKRVNLAIHSSDLLLHIITIPKVKDEEIQSVLEGKVNQYVAFAGVKTVIGWERLSDVAEGGEKKLRILLAVAKRALVDSHINAVEKAGLQIEAITIPCLAALNALKQTSLKSGPRENKIFVDLDGQRTSILFLKGGIINFVHQGDIEGLSGDLKKILRREEKLSGIVIHSQTRAADNLAERLGAELGQSVTLEQKMIAKGLAQLKRPKINLLPLEVKQAEEWRQQITYFLGAVAGVSLFMLALFFVFLLGSFLLNIQITKVKSELDRPTLQFTELKEIEDKTRGIEKLAAGRRQLAEKFAGFTWDDLFSELTTLVPSQVYLTMVEIKEEDAIMISGVADSSDHIFDFLNKLKSSKNFKNVDLQVVREEEFIISAERNE